MNVHDLGSDVILAFGAGGWQMIEKSTGKITSSGGLLNAKERAAAAELVRRLEGGEDVDLVAFCANAKGKT